MINVSREKKKKNKNNTIVSLKRKRNDLTLAQKYEILTLRSLLRPNSK